MEDNRKRKGSKGYRMIKGVVMRKIGQFKKRVNGKQGARIAKSFKEDNKL